LFVGQIIFLEKGKKSAESGLDITQKFPYNVRKPTVFGR
jgi:hypothetical protein